MPQERANPYPNATPAEVEAAPGGREIKAARNIAVRKFGGIPVRAFLLGENDHSPMLKGVVDLTTACYALLDSWKNGDHEGFQTKAAELEDMLEDSGLGPATVPVAEADAE